MFRVTLFSCVIHFVAVCALFSKVWIACSSSSLHFPVILSIILSCLFPVALNISSVDSAFAVKDNSSRKLSSCYKTKEKTRLTVGNGSMMSI